MEVRALAAIALSLVAGAGGLRSQEGHEFPVRALKALGTIAGSASGPPAEPTAMKLTVDGGESYHGMYSPPTGGKMLGEDRSYAFGQGESEPRQRVTVDGSQSYHSVYTPPQQNSWLWGNTDVLHARHAANAGPRSSPSEYTFDRSASSPPAGPPGRVRADGGNSYHGVYAPNPNANSKWIWGESPEAKARYLEQKSYLAGSKSGNGAAAGARASAAAWTSSAVSGVRPQASAASTAAAPQSRGPWNPAWRAGNADGSRSYLKAGHPDWPRGTSYTSSAIGRPSTFPTQRVVTSDGFGTYHGMRRGEYMGPASHVIDSAVNERPRSSPLPAASYEATGPVIIAEPTGDGEPTQSRSTNSARPRNPMVSDGFNSIHDGRRGYYMGPAAESARYAPMRDPPPPSN